jgi:very-short-patch-repair endonuclease
MDDLSTENTYGKLSCCACRKVFASRGFHTHDQRVHLLTQTNFKGQTANALKAKEVINEQNKINRIQQYYENPKKCLNCNTIIDIDKKENNYCSRSCSAQLTNSKKDYTKIRTGPKPKQKLEKRKRIYKRKNCIICNKEHSKSGFTCDIPCRNLYLSQQISKAVENGFNPNKNRGRSRKSYLEQSFTDWLTTNNVAFLEEHPFKIYDDLGAYVTTYFADFYFEQHNLIIELDGTQHLKKENIEYDKNRDSLISNKYGVNIFRISHAEYISQTKIDVVKTLLLLK